MSSNETLIPIPGRLHSVAVEGNVVGANEVVDDTNYDVPKKQSELNADFKKAIVHSTYIGEDNYVYAWNEGTRSYTKTSIYTRGEGFHVSKTFESISEMEAYAGTDLKEGDFILIQSNTEDPDNAKLYTYSGTQGVYKFLVDMSGAIGFTGKTPQILIGTITTVEPNAPASASLTSDGTDSDGNPKYKLSLAIPKGLKGDKGDPFVYSDFTPQQLAALKGEKGDKGDAFEYSDFTQEQLNALKVKGDKGDKGDTGNTGATGATFTPSVDDNGNLSWTNDGNKQNPATVNIKGDRGEKGDTVIIGEGEEYTLYNQTGNHTDGAMTQAAVTEEFEKLDEVYARNDGYYESMGVGTATNLKGQNTVDAEFAYRKSGGNVEVQDGNAMIEAIKGNTLAWNQLINNISGLGTASVTVTKDGELNVSNGTVGNNDEYALAFNATQIIDGHKYLAKFTVSENGKFGFYVNGISIRYDYNGAAVIWQEKSAGGYHHVVIYNPANTTITNVKWHIDLFDLTLIYGSGSEPATVEQFEQDYFMWFGKPLTYEPYDAGSLRNTKVSALKTTGFNQWDEQWEVGGMLSGAVNTKNPIRVIGGTQYRCTYVGGDINITALYIRLFDANVSPLNGYESTSGKPDFHTNSSFTMPSNAAYMTFRLQQQYGTTYNHDICINISDVNRNGEYEPYKESTLPLDVTTLTGKLNGEGSSVVVFADGMNNAGNAHDEIKIENDVVKAIKRVGKMDLGSLDWVYIAAFEGRHYFRANVSDIKKPSSDDVVGNILCTRYKTDTAQNVYDNVNNKSISIANVDNQPLRVYDEQITSQSDFQTAMQGVELCYELAEPEVYMLDDFNLPKLYPVANGGTEEQLSNSPNSLPATLSIRYGLNAAAFIQNAPKNYISKESMTNFLNNLGSAMGGAWSMTWNSSTNKYDFSFSQNRSVDVEQPIEDK